MATSKIPVFKEEILWEKLDELSSHMARVTRVGSTYRVLYVRIAPVINGSECLAIPVEYAPTSLKKSFDWYMQDSGYAVIEGQLKTNGVVILAATTYNQPVAGVFEWVYSK